MHKINNLLLFLIFVILIILFSYDIIIYFNDIIIYFNYREIKKCSLSESTKKRLIDNIKSILIFDEYHIKYYKAEKNNICKINIDFCINKLYWCINSDIVYKRGDFMNETN